MESARKKLIGMRLGVIGAPSDWLISSIASPVAVKQKLGIEIVNIAIDEVVDAYNAIADTPSDCATLAEKATTKATKEAVTGAVKLYYALKEVATRHRLNGFTIRCFDLLGVVRNLSLIHI